MRIKQTEKLRAFKTIEEAKAEFPTPEKFRVALVDDVHFEAGRFDGLDSEELLIACGVQPGDVDKFCLSQVPSNRYLFQTSDTGWNFIYTYRIPGKNRRTVRFKSEHGCGGVCESCDGPYVYRRRRSS